MDKQDQVNAAREAIQNIPALRKLKVKLSDGTEADRDRARAQRTNQAQPAGPQQKNEPPIDDHDAVVGETWQEGTIDKPDLQPGTDEVIETPKTNQKTAMRGTAYTPNPDTIAKTHPVLTQLRKDFGIDSVETLDYKLAGHVWTMRPLPAGLYGLAMSFAEQNSASPVEYGITIRTAVAAGAIVAIDSEPVYLVFKVNTGKLPIPDPLDPPIEVARIAAVELMSFLYGENKRFTLANKLYDFYREKLDVRSEVLALYHQKGLDENRLRYKCPKEGCPEEYLEVPLYEKDDDPSTILPVYCKRHGVQMNAVSDLDSESDTQLG